MSSAVKMPLLDGYRSNGLPSLPIYRLSIEQYHRMIQTGVLAENDPVELLEGLLVSKMPHNPVHDGTISVTLRKLWNILPSSWIVRVQSAVTLDDSEPEPDLAVVRGPEERYLAVHPTPKDISLLIEVGDTTVSRDRDVKGPVYARNRIPCYWIINLAENHVEAYSQPVGGKSPRYRKREDFGLEYGVPVIIAGKEIGRLAVRRLLT